MRANVFLWRVQANPFQGVVQRRVQDPRIDERWVRHLARHEQCSGQPSPTFPDVLDNGPANVLWQRHALVPFALATDQDRALAPVNVIELDRDDFGPAEPKSRRQAEHGIVAQPDGIAGPGRIDYLLDGLRVQMTWQMAWWRHGYARYSVGEIAFCLSAPEQEPEQIAQMSGRRLVPIGLCTGPDLTQEGNDIVRCNAFEVAKPPPETERHESL